MRELQNQVRQHDVIILFSFIASSSSVYQELNSQSLAMIAQIIAQILHNQSLLVVQVFVNSVAVSTLIKFKKLFDISEYEKNKDWLNVWKQSLIQRMNINDDRYLFHQVKIVYVESWFIIDKKIHNLMSQYRVNDLCIIFIFADWWHKLHHCCDNSFETEDAHLYLRETLKQDMNSFVDYYNLFYQKKEHSLMKDFSLIVWSAMSIISLKSSSSSDEISMKLDHSSFINEFKHSLTLMKSFSSLSIVNLASSSSLFRSSKSRTSLRRLVILWVQKSSLLWLLSRQYLRLSLSRLSMSQWI